MQAELICHIGEQRLLRVLVPRGPAVARGKQEPRGHGPTCPGRSAGTSEVRGKQEPCGHGPTCPGRSAATSEVRGKQEPRGHSPTCPGRRAGAPLWSGQAGAPWTQPHVSREKDRATPFFPIQSLYSFISLINLALSVKADDGRMPDQLAVNGVRRSGDVKSEWHQWLLF